jgi:hypothetical protein
VGGAKLDVPLATEPGIVGNVAGVAYINLTMVIRIATYATERGNARIAREGLGSDARTATAHASVPDARVRVS